MSAVKKYADSNGYSITEDGKRVAFSYAKRYSLTPNVTTFFTKYNANKDYFNANSGGGAKRSDRNEAEVARLAASEDPRERDQTNQENTKYIIYCNTI